MKRRRVLALTLAMAVTAATILSACGGNSSGGDDKKSGTESKSGQPVQVVLAQANDPATLDPHKTSGDQGANVFRNICETLTTYDAKDNLIPLLAKSWEQTGENEWVFKLEEGVSFSNGEKLDAKAVGWNLDRGADADNPRQNMAYRGYYAIGGWEAVDELTIRIKTTAPCPIFANYMCDLPMLAPDHSGKIGEEAIGRDPVGTGPYVLKSWETDQQITLVQNPAYRGEKPQVDTYIIKTIPEAATRVAELIAGNVDILYDVNYEYIPMLEGQGGVNVENKATRRVEYIGFNTYDWTPNPQLLDKRVRQALNYAVDKKTIIDTVMGGFSTELASIYRKDFPGYDAKIQGYPYDPEKARQLLAEAGYPNGFDITMMTTEGNHAKAVEVCEAVGAYLKAVGVNCKVETYEDATSRNIIINGQSQKLCPGLFDWNWASKPTLFDSWLTGIIHSTGMSSYNAIEGYDELVDKIMSINTMEEKIPYLQQLQEKLVDDPPYIYLFQLGSIYATSSKLDWSAANTQFILAKEMKVK